MRGLFEPAVLAFVLSVIPVMPIAATPSPDATAAVDDAEAQFDRGVMDDTGRGVAQDRAAAARWYRKAADQSHVSSSLATPSARRKRALPA